MNSALATIRAAVPTAKLVEAGRGFVGRTGAAESMGMSRQNLRKLMVANRATLPVPVHQGSSACLAFGGPPRLAARANESPHFQGL